VPVAPASSGRVGACAVTVSISLLGMSVPDISIYVPDISTTQQADFVVWALPKAHTLFHLNEATAPHTTTRGYGHYLSFLLPF